MAAKHTMADYIKLLHYQREMLRRAKTWTDKKPTSAMKRSRAKLKREFFFMVGQNPTLVYLQTGIESPHTA